MEQKRLMDKADKVNGKIKITGRFNLLSIFLVLSLFLVLIISVLPLISADYTRTSNYNVLNGGIGSLAGGFFGETEGKFDRSMCEAGQDFILQIAPAGCSPPVVRSDLLEEQNAPIYCQISATQMNPLVDVKSIDWISFSGQTPSEVAGVSFFPNNAALGTGRGTNFETTLGTNPILSDIGYAVIVLKRQPNESAMPEYVEGNLTAKIKYNIQNAWGVGQATYYLPEMNEDDFNDKYKSYGFWDGRGFLKADSIDVDSAIIGLYSGKTEKNTNNERQRIKTITLKEGETSDKIYMTGFNYCLANMRIRLDDISYPDIRAKLKVNADIVEVADDETFLEGKCRVTDIEKYGVNEQVEARCSEDANSGALGSKSFTLKIAPRIILEINGQNKTVGLGDFVEKTSDGKGLYIGYIGSEKDTNKKENLQAVFVVLPETMDKLDEDTLNQVSGRLGSLYEDSTSPRSAIAFLANAGKALAAVVLRGVSYTIEGNDYKYLKYSETQLSAFDYRGVKIKIKDFASAVDAELTPEIRDYYEKAIDDYDEVINNFASESHKSVNLGKDAFEKKMALTDSMQQRKTLVELCNQFKQQYPAERISETCSKALQLSSWTSSSRTVMINGKAKEISLDGIYKPNYIDYGVEGTVTNRNTKEVYTFTLKKNEIQYLSEGAEGYLFTLKRGGSYNDLYFKFENNIWKWATTGAFYSASMFPDEFTKKGLTGQMLTEANIIFIKTLDGQSFDTGKSIITNAGATISSTGKAEYIQLTDIKDENNANLLTEMTVTDPLEKMRRAAGSLILTFKKDVPQGGIGNYEIKITKINIKRVAKVSILPNIDYSGTETKIKFKIGIEKRNNLLKLSPEQAKDKINSLNESVKKIEKISSSLGTAVTGLKTACLSIGAFFTIENLIEGFSGEGIARQKVMRGSGGWFEKCDKWKTEKIGGESYTSFQDCLFKNSDKIEADVDRYYGILSAQNKKIEEKRTYIKEGGLFSEDVVDGAASLKAYSDVVQTCLSSYAGTQITDSAGNNPIGITDVNKILSSGTWDTYKNYNFEQLREIGFYCDALKQNPKDTIAQQRLYSSLFELKKNYDVASTESKVSTMPVQPEGMEKVTVRTYGSKDSIKGEYDGGTAGPGFLGVAKGTPVQKVSLSNVIYYFVLEQNQGNDFRVKQVYNEKGEIIEWDKPGTGGKTAQQIASQFSGFVRTDEASYGYEWKKPYVRYYETGSFKGYPAIVPVEPKGGWYAGLKQTIPFGSNIRTADASGRVYSYYLCHVGGNGEPNFFEDKFGDDKCQMIVTDSPATYTVFSSLSASKITSLVNKAKEAIISAQKGYLAGAKKVNIDGVSVAVESPASEIPAIECEDVMSPSQCKILFNVCDPVICPSSRCNLGGAYSVTDVVQSGVIGSIVLCWPNIREGIYIPVCLTGVKAGLDNWISIEKSYRDCLQEQINTGKTVGICDEIQSIYACEFFWRQGLPLAKIALPALANTIFGQNTRGGGEYSGITDAFNRAEKSVTYFTQYYGANSFAAFKARSTDEVGGEVCKSFVSAVYPSSGNMLDSLTQPDSPPQFTGNFEEIPFTTATNPPASQYKVFYHIYAGTDSGAYFRVYLKGSPGSSYYQDTAVARVVDYAYVEKGGYKSNTVDFTAPSGYSQLCILVNGLEECGFKQVSTDFTINYMKEQYLKEQSTTKVTSEAECISGTPSLYSLLNPNLQEGVGNVINAELYQQGIYRICATDNPGIGTNPARWDDVGYCDNTRVRCWIDKDSVKNVIKNANIEADTLAEINKNMQEKLATTGESLNFDSTETEINNLADDKQKIIKITDVIGKFYKNSQKGWLLILKGDAYGRLAAGLFKAKTDPTMDAINKKDCIMNSATGRTFRVADVKTSTQNSADLNKWCDENGGTGVCEGTSGAFTGLKESAMFTCPPGSTDTTPTSPEIAKTLAQQAVIDDTLSKITSYPQIKSDLFPARVRIITHNFFGDLGSADHIYEWNNVVWTYRNDNLAITDSSPFESYKKGLNSIGQRIKTEDDNNKLSGVEVQCGYKTITITNLFTIARGSSASSLYLKFENNVWHWRTVLTWFPVADAIPNNYISADNTAKGQFLTKDNIELIESLRGQKYYGGYRLISAKGGKEETSSSTTIGVSAVEIIDEKIRENCASSSIAGTPNGGTSTAGTTGAITYNPDITLQQMIEYITKASQKYYGDRICNCGDNCVTYANLILEVSKKYILPDPVLFLSLMMQESSCKLDAASGSSYGLMQISSWEICKDELGLKSINDVIGSGNVKNNIACGAIILKEKYDFYNKGVTFNGCTAEFKSIKYYGWEAALRGYNGLGCDPSLPAQDKFVPEIANRFRCLKDETQCGTGTASATPSTSTTPTTISCEFRLTQKGWWSDFSTGDFWFVFETNSWRWKTTNSPKTAPEDYKIISSSDSENEIFKDSKYSSYKEIIKDLPAFDYVNGVSFLVNYVNNVLKDEQLIIIKDGKEVYTTTGTNDFDKIKSLCGLSGASRATTELETPSGATPSTGQTVIEVKTIAGEPVTGNVVVATNPLPLLSIQDYVASQKLIEIPIKIETVQIYTQENKDDVQVTQNNQPLPEEKTTTTIQKTDESIPKEVVIGDLPAISSTDKLSVNPQKLDSILKENNVAEKNVIINLETSPKPIPPAGEMQIPNTISDGSLIVKDKLGVKLLEIPISKIDSETKTIELDTGQATKCDNMKENLVAKLDGSKYSCNPTSKCREGFNLGQLDCGTGNSCCRPICETSYSGFQCTDTTKYTCSGDIRRGYCPGGSEVVCCKRGTAIVSITTSFTVYPAINKRISEIINGDKSFASHLEVCEGINCAGFVSVTFDYVFGAGKRFVSGVYGNAWEIPENVKSIGDGTYTFYDWKNGQMFTNYNSLKPGDLIGFHYTQSDYIPSKQGLALGNTPEIDFTHIALYLGEKDNKHYIAHLYHVPSSLKKSNDVADSSGVRVESIENFLSLYGNYFKIRAVIKQNQEILYKEPPVYETQEYTIKSGDSVLVIASKINNGLTTQENAWLISYYNSIFEPNYLNTGKKILIPTSKIIASSQGNTGYSNVVSSLAVKINQKYNKKDQDDWGYNWAKTIYNAAKYKNPEYLSLIASLIDTETSFNTQTGEKMQQTAFNLLPSSLKDSLYTNSGKDIGCMDIKICKAINIQQEITPNKEEAKKIVYDTITSQEGCVFYGEKYLSKVAESHLSVSGKFDKDTIDKILSDYVAGEYSSRNAALQKQLRELTGISLTLDGDFLIYEANCGVSSSVSQSQKAAESFVSIINDKFKDNSIQVSQVRSMLTKEKTKGFENTLIYKKIKQYYKEKILKNQGEPEYTIITQAPRYSDTGLERDRLSDTFVNEVTPNYQHYCSGICTLA